MNTFPYDTIELTKHSTGKHPNSTANLKRAGTSQSFLSRIMARSNWLLRCALGCQGGVRGAARDIENLVFDNPEEWNKLSVSRQIAMRALIAEAKELDTRIYKLQENIVKMKDTPKYRQKGSGDA
jgi:hypothetical protein